ncbi:MAG TPA: bifunctional 4-hydroxy-2-oxoglutarate aldolase/2-dehydro-3-deoxy-phosphogluconate aldolase [Streptosporangiaceae bacterium]|nr:bifunctional 4-hydroxy-2-oxoglutarate aldolase/2-dehydro-3-deoxy-phosphogluconate aldolase [Streptosporangiaceae bacterium]
MSALDLIADCGVVPVVVIDDWEAAPALGDALVAAGLPVAEITLRTDAAVRAAELLARDSRFTVGAGTVLTPADVDLAVAAGARFIVSPGFDVEVVRRCRQLGAVVIPGIATASEAMAALREGLGVVKLFPAEPLGGLRWLNALAAPFPGLRFVPTGGIGPAELAEYARHAAVTAVGGSWIAPRALLRAGEFDEISRLAAAAVATVAAARRPEGAHHDR